MDRENSSGNGVITWELYNNVAAIVGRDPSYNPIATIAVGAAGGITRKIQEKQKETNDKKRFKLSKTYIEEQFDGVNENIRNIDTSIRELINVQERRNDILDRIANSIENALRK